MPVITIGQYYPTGSPVHGLDPRLKLVCSFVYVIVLFLISSGWGYVAAAIFLFGCIKLARVPIRFVLRGLRAIFFLLSFTIVLNIFMFPGEELLFSVGFVGVYREGVLMAVMLGTRLCLLVIGSALLTLTTPPIELTGAMEYVMTPLKRLRVPTAEIAMMMTIALRFIPTLIEEMHKIMKAQKARGADFESGGLIKKARGLVPLLVPLFVSAFRRADELAMAMEARCYRPDAPRTKMKIHKLGRTDFVAIGASVAAFSVILSFNWL